MGISEKPNTIAGIEKPVLLLQVKEELRFSILPTAPKQANSFVPGGLSLFPWYGLWGDSKGRRVSFADEYLLTQKNKHSHTQWGKLGRYV